MTNGFATNYFLFARKLAAERAALASGALFVRLPSPMLMPVRAAQRAANLAQHSDQF